MDAMYHYSPCLGIMEQGEGNTLEDAQGRLTTTQQGGDGDAFLACLVGRDLACILVHKGNVPYCLRPGVTFTWERLGEREYACYTTQNGFVRLLCTR